MMTDKFPKLEKSIEDFLLDEEGNIPRSKILAVGSMMMVLSVLFTQNVYATHYSHQSHRSHYSHGNTNSSHGNTHSSHSSMPNVKTPNEPMQNVDVKISTPQNMEPISVPSSSTFSVNSKTKK